MAPDVDVLERLGGARRLGRRASVLLGLVALGVVAVAMLDTPARGLWPSASGLDVAADLLGKAFSPAFDYEDPKPGYRPFLATVALAAWRTVLLAAGGMSMALVLGAILGVLGSSAYWDERSSGSLTRGTTRTLHAAVRLLIALMRSVHELLWAILFLAAFGLTPFAAVLALAIPYGGTLAKVFSEMLDEEPREPAHALRGIGASRRVEFALGLVPGAMPNVIAYSFYRFECALRSAAVMGFFGIPTLGLDLKLAWNNLNYHEVWTYLYALVALVLVFESWSAGLRRRFVA